jgi:hypothetical protein
MAITTDITTAIGQTRYAIGDDVEGTGVLPTGANFTDQQVQYELDAVSSSIQAAAARLCWNLARRYATLPQSFSADGLSINRGDAVARWNALAEQFTAEIMGGNFGTVTLDRRDAYSALWEQGGDSLLRIIDNTYTG